VQVESLRLIPNLRVLRPADAEEANVAWQMALERSDGPTALILTRQNLPVFEKPAGGWREACRKGAYVALDCGGKPDVVVVATGADVEMAMKAAGQSKKKVRVMSMISRELFEAEEASFKNSLLPPGARVMTAEAGVGAGWAGIASSVKDIFCINRFGESGTAAAVAEALGDTASRLASLIG